MVNGNWTHIFTVTIWHSNLLNYYHPLNIINNTLQEKGIEPLFLVSKTNVLPIRRLLGIGGTWTLKIQGLNLMCLPFHHDASWGGTWTHTPCFANKRNNHLCYSAVSRGNRTLIIWLTVKGSTIKLARYLWWDLNPHIKIMIKDFKSFASTIPPHRILY